MSDTDHMGTAPWRAYRPFNPDIRPVPAGGLTDEQIDDAAWYAAVRDVLSEPPDPALLDDEVDGDYVNLGPVS